MIDFQVKLNNTQLYVVSLSASMFMGIEFTFFHAGSRTEGVVYIAQTKCFPQSTRIAISIWCTHSQDPGPAVFSNNLIGRVHQVKLITQLTEIMMPAFQCHSGRWLISYKIRLILMLKLF